jgi:hypothetical protein
VKGVVVLLSVGIAFAARAPAAAVADEEPA